LPKGLGELEQAIEAFSLTKRYGELVAVDRIDFQVQKGEIFGFLGPNGAGKTTTIRMLTGLTRPFAGRAAVMGYDIARQIQLVKRCTGVVPEISNLYDELTCWDNLVFMGQLFGVPRVKRKKRAQDLLETFGLTQKKDNSFRTLSRGMKRRLTIAAALVHEPSVVFLDEPTTGLDVMSARSLRETIKKMKEDGLTIFLTTHNIEEAGTLCDRIALMVKGRITITDTPDGLRKIVDEEPAFDVVLVHPVNGIEQAIKETPGVKKVSIDGCNLRISVERLNDALPNVTRALQEAGAQVIYFNTIRPSLEEAFVRLTGLSREMMQAEAPKRRAGNAGA